MKTEAQIKEAIQRIKQGPRLEARTEVQFLAIAAALEWVIGPCGPFERFLNNLDPTKPIQVPPCQ